MNVSRVASWLVITAATVAGCAEPLHPLGELRHAEDLDPDPAVFETNLTARIAEVEFIPGTKTRAWTYDGSVPGPLIEAKVGDELVVHFRNELPEATTIHWHGLRVPAAMDGTAATQAGIPPGGTFEYRFKLLDAGLFWFHPHLRSDVQVERGLYGVIRVKGDLLDDTQQQERVVVLDDVRLDGDGAFGAMGPMMEMTGREGEVVLANGTQNAFMDVLPGERVRLRLVNVANARYFNLELPGRTLLLVGVDGGLLESPRHIERLLLAPGERADVIIEAHGKTGERWELRNAPYARGHGTGMEPARPVLTLRFTRGSVSRESIPSELRAFPSLPTVMQTRRFALSEDAAMGHGGHTGPTFRINGQAYPDITPVQTSLGQVEEWEIVNETEMDHPFHLHGFFFQVLNAAGAAPDRAWKDTVNIPAQASLRFVVDFDQHPGTWMYHCHILEHAERGMLGEVVVAP